MLGSPQPLEMGRWELAERFGWTLEYVDALSVDKLHEYLQVQVGRGKAARSILPRRGMTA